MNTAILEQDDEGRYRAMFNGMVLASSTDKQYVINSIENGLSTKARLHKVTMIRERGVEEKSTVPSFSINERFDFLQTLTGMVINRSAPSLLVTGEGGLGKTYTIMSEIKKAGLSFTTDFEEKEEDEEEDEGEIEDVEYDGASLEADVHVIKGFSTAKGLYRSLFDHNGRIVVFDDCDSIFKDTNAINIMKGALDSYDERWICWNAEMKGDDLPRKFEFTGSIIFISNMSQDKIDGAIKSRSLRVDLSMTPSEKIERMEAIIQAGTFMPEIELEVKMDALSFLKDNQKIATELSMRTLISIAKIRNTAGPTWKRLASYILTA